MQLSEELRLIKIIHKRK